MNNYNNNGNEPQEPQIIHESDTKEQLLKYLHLIRQNIIPVALIIAAALVSTYIYLKTADRVYRSVTTVKLEKGEPDVLQGSLVSEQAGASFNFIPNQIQILKSYEIRDRVAAALLDTFILIENKDDYTHLIHNVQDDPNKPASPEVLRRRLNDVVKIGRIENLDILSLSCESNYFEEAFLITNMYASEYIKYLNELKMQDLSTLKKFIEIERQKKLNELNNIESHIGDFQRRNGFTNIDSYSQYLTETIRSTEAAIRQARLEKQSNKQSYDALEKELRNIDSGLVNYVSLQINEASLTEVQKQINSLEIQRELDLASAENDNMRSQIKAVYEEKLNTLRRVRDTRSEEVLNNLNANTPIEKKEIVRNLFNLNLNRIALDTKINEYEKEIENATARLNILPDLGLELAKLLRMKATNEKLYTQLEEKYQETEIRERTRVGDAYILDPGLDNSSPVKPDKMQVAIIGILSGLGLAFLFVFIRNMMDTSIKDPSELEKKGVTMLSWIPTVPELQEEPNKELEFVVLNQPTSNISESFKALRTRIKFSRPDEKPIKKILVTSCLPSEGKTIVSLNLAGSFALAGKKTLLVDCDLRKPRQHTIFGIRKSPGLTDHLFGQVKLDEIVHKTKMKDLSFMPSGTIPPNPSELLGSEKMRSFTSELEKIYDIIIIDSPPFVSVTDAEILFNNADGVILVAKAGVTPIDIYIRSYARMYELDHLKLLGGVLNDFNYQKSYGYYYNYYYYYQHAEKA